MVKNQIRASLLRFAAGLSRGILLCMNMFLSHISALEGLRDMGNRPQLPAGGFHASCPSPDEVKMFVRMHRPTFSHPIHLLVPAASKRTRCSDVLCHVLSKSLPSDQFVFVYDGVCAPTAEMCFVLLASVVSFARLIEIGCELCGSYRRANNERGYIQAKPLTRVADLRRFVDGLEGVEGVGRARRALDCVVDGSASPMETVVVMFASLPSHRGGYGVLPPIMNGYVGVPPSKRRAVSKSCYYCDLYWPSARLALEYESDEHHTGSRRIFSDSSRRADLAHLGVEVVTLTKLQVFDRREFEKVIQLLKKRLGLKSRPAKRDWTPERVALRHELLDFSRAQA